MNELVDIYESINRKTYSRKINVLKYKHFQQLTPGEQAIIDQFRDDIYNKSILDIGCGAGRTARFLKTIGGKYTGIDYSEEAIIYCRHLHKDTRFIHCDARNMDCFEDEEFDVVIFPCNGIDSMDSTGRGRVIDEVFRLVKSGGLFILTTHNYRFLIETWNGKTPFPTLTLSANPKTLLANLGNYTRASLNYLKNSRYVRMSDQSAIVQGVAFDYDLMTYYIDKRKQIVDLKTAGFTVERLYDRDGLGVAKDSSQDGYSPWLYYVARKVPES